MKNKVKIIFKVVAVILIFILLARVERPPAEDLSIPSAVGFDIEKMKTNILYKISMSSYVFRESGNTLEKEVTGTDYSPVRTREKRQLKLDKNYITGIQKTFVISEKLSREGMKPILDAVFNNLFNNDTTQVTICEGEAKDILQLKVPGYPTAGDYIEQMVKNSVTHNFFESSYKIIDVIVKADSEGRSVKLPYIRNSEKGLAIEGLALFKNDRMVQKINMHDARILNMLSEDPGKGIITLQKSSDSYMDYYAKVKRKVKCSRSDGKYVFDIKLKFNGDIVTNNEYNKKAQEKYNEKKKLEEELEKHIEKGCKEFINKMQKLYKIDCLDLGRIAASKYGRDTGTDWDKAVSDSEINVKVSVNIQRQGRGEY